MKRRFSILRSALAIAVLAAATGLHRRHHSTGGSDAGHHPDSEMGGSSRSHANSNAPVGTQQSSLTTTATGSTARPTPLPAGHKRDGKGVVRNKGRFAPDPDKPERTKPSVEEDPYQRPGLRDTTKREIWDQAVADSEDGKVRDPETGEVIDEDSNWQAGHQWGWEFRKHRAAAEEAGTSREDFIEEYNKSEHYRPETKATNESHRGEAPDNVDFWKEYYATKNQQE